LLRGVEAVLNFEELDGVLIALIADEYRPVVAEGAVRLHLLAHPASF
jgi:hypothetical protein